MSERACVSVCVCACTSYRPAEIGGRDEEM